ncbi:MAG: upp [Caulobacter sp.]|nr:upp [Caulobacter sp.]
MAKTPKTMPGVTVVDHPLVRHKLTRMRDKDTSTRTFRDLTREISLLLCYEVTRDLPLEMVRIDTPLAGEIESEALAGKKLVFAAILRAGTTMVEGMLDLAPSARVAHIGLYRNRDAGQTVEYYFKAPDDIAERLVIVVDTLLATGGTAVAAVERLKEAGARDIRFVCLVASPQGIAAMQGDHPGVKIWTAAIDDGVDERGFIMPGLGDAGDRLFGTK